MKRVVATNSPTYVSCGECVFVNKKSTGTSVVDEYMSFNYNGLRYEVCVCFYDTTSTTESCLPTYLERCGRQDLIKTFYKH